jgi:hypothetical protein
MAKKYFTKKLPQHQKDVAVVIPVYKETMTANEKISFEQCLSVLYRYPIVLLAPEGLNLDTYTSYTNHFIIQRFDTSFFQNIQGYNKLMLSKVFYERFLEYKYILIYQLDAFVFSDQLDDWCSRGYDYVGAPWLDRCNYLFLLKKSPLRSLFLLISGRLVNNVGNGGLSLRKVRTFFRLSSLFKRKALAWKSNEDYFWSYWLGFYPFLKIPAYKEALSFSFELNPEKCFILNKYEYPFGCHAWERYDIDFWRPVFSRFGYTI